MGKLSFIVACLMGLQLCAEEFHLPKLLVTEKGEKVTTVEQWEKVRRPEILNLFETQVYGKRTIGRPATLRFSKQNEDRIMLDGKAIRKMINISYTGPYGKGDIRLTAFIPRQAKPAPAFLLICNRSEKKNLDPERKIKSPFWPVELLISRGYAALAFYYEDVSPDHYDGFKTGVQAIFQQPKDRTNESWGTLSAWAWGGSRVMDWIETEPLLDKDHVAVIGHSRGGKASLVCGTTDQRFAMTISNDSGCGGAKLNRMNLPKSEHIAQITKSCRHWFCRNFDQYANNEDALPVDQHQFIALIAPRLAYIASASEDAWAGQPAEFQSGYLASPVWELYGKKGLVGATKIPAPDSPLHEGCIGYHLRTGIHNLVEYDWNCYMDFTDHHGWKK